MERIQRYRDYLNQTQPGIEGSASTAARMLLFRALERVEKEMGVRAGPTTNAVENSAARSKSRVPKSRVGDESSAHDKRFEGIGWLVSSAAIRRRRPR